ncbi:MAG: peptide ABC transporter substrate-binding protein [Candidatus Paceibacter sp.]|nr:peptide ABC transporter substrate-binding protein [Candidatus Paceibacter sp.]
MDYLKQLPKKRSKIPTLAEAVYVLRKMAVWQKIAFLLFSAAFVFSALVIISKTSDYFMIDVPAYGGSLTEGIIGTPRFINPVLAISDADRDVTALVYSGLMRRDDDGKLIKDLAESVTISNEGLVYTFTLKPDLRWHDGQPVTADDIVFTIDRLTNSATKSPKRAAWEGIDVQKTDERTVKFTLKKPFAPFLENATIGILPAHIWSPVSPEQMTFSELNIKPIGSGPYKIKEIKRNSSEVVSSYEFAANKNFSLGKPRLKKIILKFYSSEKDIIAAYQKGEIESANALTPQALTKVQSGRNAIIPLYLSRIFGAFLNQNNVKAFTKKEVRQALDISVDRKKIIEQVLKGYGTELYGPLPSGTFGAIENSAAATSSSIEKAKEILSRNGWKLNEETGILEKKSGKEALALSFVISTADAPELKETAEMLRTAWKQLGAKVEVKVFEVGDLNQNVIRPRKYDVLLFGEIVGRDPDPFAFWHSSQRNDPGLNVALYANIKADGLLEEARATFNETVRKEKYEEFQKEIFNDTPAVFVYSPKLIYVAPKDLKGVENMASVAVPSERFLSVYKWHRGTDRAWKIFADKPPHLF